MDITYTWKLTELKKTNTVDLTDVVVGTRWECTGTDEDGNTGVFNGATPFSLATVDPDSFVGWSGLTEEIVLGWIQDVLNRGGIDHVKQQIQKQIDAKKSPVIEIQSDSFPWVTSQN